MYCGTIQCIVSTYGRDFEGKMVIGNWFVGNGESVDKGLAAMGASIGDTDAIWARIFGDELHTGIGFRAWVGHGSGDNTAQSVDNIY